MNSPTLSTLRLDLDRHGQLLAYNGPQATPVRVQTCFPATQPGRFISLRDADNNEVALIPSPDDLAEASRTVLLQALAEVEFTFHITAVNRLRVEYEIRHWDVACAQGPRTFQTRKDDWPRYEGTHGLLITDVTGDLYRIEDWTALDRHSRKQLAFYID
jgi:hypothetical protein